MERIQLSVNSRQASNKGAARALRREGRIPAILYGEGSPKVVSVDAKDWASRFAHVKSNTIIILKHDKDEYNVLIKDTQDDILTGRVDHIDFYAIHAGKKLQTHVPVQLQGTPRGIIEGGIMERKIEELDVVCLPKDLPTHFSVDISHLGLGESVHVGEIDIPDGVEIRTDPGLTIAVVSHPKAESETVADDEDEQLDAGEAVAETEEDDGGE